MGKVAQPAARYPQEARGDGRRQSFREPAVLLWAQARQGGARAVDRERGAGIGGQVHLPPGDRPRREVRGQPVQAQARRHAVEARLDAAQDDVAARRAQIDVADADDPPAREVEQLRVEHVAGEQDAVGHGAERIGAQGRAARPQLRDRAPRGPGRRPPTASHHDAGDSTGSVRDARRNAEVGDTPDAAGVEPHRPPQARAQQHLGAQPRRRGPRGSSVAHERDPDHEPRRVSGAPRRRLSRPAAEPPHDRVPDLRRDPDPDPDRHRLGRHRRPARRRRHEPRSSRPAVCCSPGRC